MRLTMFAAPRIEAAVKPKTKVHKKRIGPDFGPANAKGALYRLRHDELVDEGDTATHKRVTTQAPIDRYLRRDEITDTQHKAGDRLRADFFLAGLGPCVVARLGALGGGQGDRTEKQIDARKRYRQAIRAVGLILSPVLIHVCCLDGMASEWAREKGWPRKADGLVALRLALDSLVRHYGLTR